MYHKLFMAATMAVILTGCTPKTPADKISLGLVTYQWGRDWDLNTLIANCKATGLSAVELRVEHSHNVSPSLSADERKAVKELFAQSNITLLGFGTNYEFHSPDPQIVKANIEGTKEYLLLSRDCGGSGVKVKPNDLPEGVDPETTIAQIAAALSELGRFAAEIGQEVRLEVHGGCAKIPIIKAIIDKVPEKNVGLCWNSNDQDLEDSGLEANLNSVRERLGRTVHVRELALDTYPTKKLFKLLYQSGYEGCLLIETHTFPSNEERLEKLRHSAELFAQWKKEIQEHPETEINDDITFVDHGATERKIDVLCDGKLFTSYIYPEDLEKPVLYPVYTANGTDVTRGFPRNPRPDERIDHPHHVGLWFSFGDVNGLDFWNNSYAIPAEKKQRYGSVRHRQATTAKGGVLDVICDWVDYQENILLKENTKFIFSGSGDLRCIDRITTLTAEQDSVVFTDNKEGLIAIRVDRAFEEPSEKPEMFLDAAGNKTDVPVLNNEGVNGVYRNSDGLETEKGVWGKPARWVSLSADKNGEKITIAIIDHPENPGYPAHSHARGYGLFSTNNMGSKVFDPAASPFRLVLKKGESVTFKHRIAFKTNGFATDEELNDSSFNCHPLT
ncbi:MAG: PmoA family protein [Tannerella sp.]|jgi:sugar phosphate isomerase/epimerase|nr:PmoA family protein [Tannerella sp.]